MLITRRREFFVDPSFRLSHRKSFLHAERVAGRWNPRSLSNMNHSLFSVGFRRLVSLLPILLAVLTGNSCRKPEAPAAELSGILDLPAAMRANTLAAAPGAVHARVADSPIHWQPWTPEVLAAAESSKRLIFAVIVLPQQPTFQEVLAKLAADPALVETINGNYVPVVIDVDACREIGLLTADLCAEQGHGLALPLFLWLSPAGDSVASRPATGSAAGSVEVFRQSHLMVSRMWRDDPDYVRKNSSLDNQSRGERMRLRAADVQTGEDPAQETLAAIRQLASLYDPVSRTFDLAGGLFPAGTLDLLATTAIQPGIHPEIRDRCLETIRGLTEDVLPSAMFDPLDGGLFSSRRGGGWDLPVFSRDCISQARAAFSLIQVHRASGDPSALERALGLITFAERSYRTPQGLFSLGVESPSETADWLWQVEDIEKLLPPEDAAWWIRLTGMRDLGNLASESDPLRKHFRFNSIGLSEDTAKLAARAGMDPVAFAPRYESARKLLVKSRAERLGDRPVDEIPHAASTFRMVSAYAAAYSVTGDEAHRDNAASLLGRAKEAFSDGSRLRLFTQEHPVSITAGRAFLYALAIQAALDVGEVTSDESWVDWATHLATTAAELFPADGHLAETPGNARIIDLPISDMAMLFDDSSAGLFSSASARLAARGRPVAPGLSELTVPFPSGVTQRPILYTDRLLAAVSRHYGVTVVTGDDLPAGLSAAIQRLPLRTFHRRVAGGDDGVPPGSVKVVLPDGKSELIDDEDLLKEALLPSVGKQ